MFAMEKEPNQPPTADEITKVVEAAESVVEAVESFAREIGPWANCPTCDAPPKDQEVRNYDAIWQDGDVYCTHCGSYVRHWDAG